MLFPRRKIHTGFGCEDRRQQRSDEEECTVLRETWRAPGDGAGDIFDFEKLVLLLPKWKWSIHPGPRTNLNIFELSHIKEKLYLKISESRPNRCIYDIRWSALEGEQRVMEEWISSRYLPRLLVQMGGPRCSAHTTCLSCYVICHS